MRYPGVLPRLVLPLLIALPGVAHAGDSSWLVCKGIATRADYKTYFVANVLEHRAGVDQRALSVTLVYGDHLARGEITDGSSLRASEIASKRVVFAGTGKLSDDFKTFTLDGKLDGNFGALATPRMERFHAALACEQLDDLAIGH